MTSSEKIAGKFRQGWSWRWPAGVSPVRARQAVAQQAKAELGAQVAALADPVNAIYGTLRGIVEAGKQGVVVQIVSATSGEGASSVARAVAQKAAGMGRLRTFLIDGGDTGQGSAFATLKNSRHYQPANAEACFPDDPSDVRGVYAACRKEYQLTIVDCPAIAGGGFFETAPAASDGVILVVQAEKLRPAELRPVTQLLEQHGVAIFGIVLNKTRRYLPRFLQKLL